MLSTAAVPHPHLRPSYIEISPSLRNVRRPPRCRRIAPSPPPRRHEVGRHPLQDCRPQPASGWSTWSAIRSLHTASAVTSPPAGPSPTPNLDASDSWGETLAAFDQSSRITLPDPQAWTALLQLNARWSNVSGADKDAQVPEHSHEKGSTTDATQADEPPHTLHGYVSSHRPTNQAYFIQLADPSLSHTVQLVVDLKKPDPAHTDLRARLASIKPHTPVVVVGKTVRRPSRKPAGDRGAATATATKLDPYMGTVEQLPHVEVQVDQIDSLNSWPSSLQAACDTPVPPEQRHLSFRTDGHLRQRIKLRSQLRSACAQSLDRTGFQEVETPLLFKSTPEGAREFLVPTRDKGLAYALPQSPQQYKQALMASGVWRYYQFAKCFRDEDLRADRQPEFTQLDLEVAFADSRQVMSLVEQLVVNVLWPTAGRANRLALDGSAAWARGCGEEHLLLPVMTYHDAMAKYGSDKPDPRWGAEIASVDFVPAQTKSMLSSLHDPVLDMFKISLDMSPRESRDFVTEFMKLPSSAQFSTNPDGMPGIAIYDSAAPLSGLASFGHAAGAQLTDAFQLEPGDILVSQARPRKPFSGGATALGQIRQRMHEFALQKEILPQPARDALLWVVDFPLFTELLDDAPGQGGAAAICSTHHPFTAPKPGQDLTALLRAPETVLGDHYDLVVNGVEVGGGSRRIHHVRMQELIFSHVLKMPPDRIDDFRHLLNALEAGCPPHAGFALGFDRLVALLSGVSSVREVIAFPKYQHGRDPFVGSPAPMSADQRRTYHLDLVEEVPSPPGQELPASKTG